ncbi:MAG: LptF/LptG family permease, partial [Acinetobacter sp.]|nr:LptF/LptG family permease [Acinetobacter sp.]
MIIRRYLVKQVVSTSLVVVTLLTVIMMGGQLIKRFGQAAMGRVDPSILLSIIGFRLPEFLTLILPLGFFIGLMLVFGRLYVDHEMAVLNGSG